MKPRVTKFPGICRFAREAGVSRVHAWFVLRGLRQSPRLTRLWNKFSKKQLSTSPR